MAFDPNLFTVDINPDPINIVLGKTGEVTITASNSNPSDWGYNLTYVMTIPDGASFVSADVPPSSQTLNVDSTITLTWLDIKDLAPNEIGYTFNVVLMSDENFRSSGADVPFDTPLTPVDISGTVDTLPRGDSEPGNIKYTKSDSTSVVPLQYAVTKTVPAKMPKGASTPPPDNWPYTHEIVIENNTRQSSTVDINDIMDNGLRYIGPIVAVGPDSAQLLAPTIVIPTPGGQDNVTITWDSIVLSINSTNIITYVVAIWDNFTVGGVENSGSRIPHQTPLSNDVIMTGLPGPSVTSTGTTLAMDLTIDKSQTPTTIDIGTIITYTLTYRVNQYDNVDSVVITDVISDGQTYQNASVPPDAPPVKDPVTGLTTVTWSLGTLITSTNASITFTTVVDNNYTAPPGDPVIAGDTLSNAVNIDGTNANSLTPTPDSSGSSGMILIPSITKQLVQVYYRDGTPKPASITAVAPGDLVEFQINYQYLDNATQKEILVSDFLPLTLDAASISNLVYNPFLPATGPTPTGNNGVEWFLNNFLVGSTNWTVNFQVSMFDVDFVGTDVNLAKLSGLDTDGIAYSDRDQIDVDFGQPNMVLTKSVAGPSPDAIVPGQTYTYTVVISNPQNVDGTIVDAFDVDFSDVIPNLLTYVAGSLTAVASSGTPVFSAPTFTNPDQIDMQILHLKPDDAITLTYQVTVDAGIGPNISLTNDANTTSPYSQQFDPNLTNYQYPGLERSASETLTTASMPLTKTVDISDRLVGDTVNYTLTWTVPLGLTAYDVIISDTLPVGQSYDNDASPVDPISVVGQVITWPTIPVVDATVQPVTLVYSFRALIDSSVSIPPTYIEIQTNTGTVNWNSIPGGLPMEESGTVDVNVSNPNIVPVKGERNVSRGQMDYLVSTEAIAGEIIEYRVIITNDGAADAYDITIIDQPGGLAAGLNYIPLSIVAPPGTTASYDVMNNYIQWNVPILGIGDSLQLLFRVRVTNSVTPGDTLTNTSQVVSYTNINMTFFYPSVNSNSVSLLIESGVRGIALKDLDDFILY